MTQEQLFRGQQPGEQVVCFFRKHWISMLPHLLFLAVFAVLTIIYFFNLHRLHEAMPLALFKIIFLLTAFVSLSFVHYFFLKIIQHFFHVVIITNSRIIAMSKSLFVNDDKEAFDLRMIQEIHKHQNGFLSNLFQYGDLSITLTQSSAILRLTCVPNPEHCFRLIIKAKEDHIDSRIRMKLEMQEDFRSHGSLDNHEKTDNKIEYWND